MTLVAQGLIRAPTVVGASRLGDNTLTFVLFSNLKCLGLNLLSLTTYLHLFEDIIYFLSPCFQQAAYSNNYKRKAPKYTFIFQVCGQYKFHARYCKL